MGADEITRQCGRRRAPLLTRACPFTAVSIGENFRRERRAQAKQINMQWQRVQRKCVDNEAVNAAADQVVHIAKT